MPENNIEKSFGLILKEARANKHISLEEASKHTRIHVNILKAIESDDVAALGTVYVKSFLRLYAEYLGVDKEDVLSRFRQVTGQAQVSNVRRVAEPSRNTANLFLKNYKFIIAGVILFIVIASIVRFVKSHPAKPRQAKISVQKAVSKPPQTVVKNVEVKKAPAPVPAKKPVSVESTVSAAAGKSAEKTQKKIVLVIKAKDKCWLQVKVDGKVVFQNVLAKGSSESWQAYEKIELWLGNAGAVQFELNGKLLQKIGRPGQTLRHVVVTRAGLSIRG